MKDYEYKKIYELLKSINRLDLVSQLMFERSFNEINNILTMPEWQDIKFQGLLTSTIWSSNYEDIKKKIYLPYWSENKYLQLLVPSIFSISIKNIESGIALLKQYNIDQYVTNKCLRLKTEFLGNLLEYLVANDIDLISFNQRTQQYGLNPILNCEKGQLNKKFNINVDRIEKGEFSK